MSPGGSDFFVLPHALDHISTMVRNMRRDRAMPQNKDTDFLFKTTSVWPGEISPSISLKLI